MSSLVVPEGYKSILSLRDRQRAIKISKDTFERELSNALSLERVSAPIMVLRSSGLNDNLNGVERPVGFDIPEVLGEQAEIVHSLAQCKRQALKLYDFEIGRGLYTDMNAI